jgi:uncharacterized protein (DUF2141 family)
MTMWKLEVSISGLKNTDGDIALCLWLRDDEGFPYCGTGKPFKKVSVPAAAAKAFFEDLPSGEYAVSLFHDERKLGTPEFAPGGAPLCGVGLSNNPAPAPGSSALFEQASVPVPETTAIEIIARYR